MEVYERNLHINDETFEGMRMDADRVLQKLIKNMVEKEALEGSITIKVDVVFTQEYVPNFDPVFESESRKVLIPRFSHKIGSVMQIKDEAKGGSNYDGFELVWDDEAGEFVMKPIANTAQKTIFDADFRCVNDPDEEEDTFNEGDKRFLEGRCVAALPGPFTEESEKLDGEVDTEDISGEFDEEDSVLVSEGEDDDYNYEEPEED